MKVALLLALALSGCHTMPVKPTFPEAPSILMEACPDLEQMGPNQTQLSDLLQTVARNYSQYHQCQIKLEQWTEWYLRQRDLFNTKL